MKFLFSLILLSIACIAHAQSDFRPGYIVTNEFDTITGLVDYRSDLVNMKVCSFKKTEASVTENYYPGDIYGYWIDEGKYYVSKVITEKAITDVQEKYHAVFMEYLVDGEEAT